MRTILLILNLISLPSFACVDFSGTYLEERWTTKIVQKSCSRQSVIFRAHDQPEGKPISVLTNGSLMKNITGDYFYSVQRRKYLYSVVFFSDNEKYLHNEIKEYLLPNGNISREGVFKLRDGSYIPHSKILKRIDTKSENS